MECVAIEQMEGTGAETHMDCWDSSMLVSLYGDVGIDLLDYDADRPLDYDAAIQEQGIEIPSPS